ncbi:MAG TPA: hypothetical protein VFX25_01740 [Streptosporangiaceae bacterium]|nr:hypothetical protein [Streptosporangiaceae bacterium]
MPLPRSGGPGRRWRPGTWPLTLAAADDACSAAVRARRLLREAVRAASPPRSRAGTQPGELRGLVALRRGAPGEELGPHAIGRAIGGRSSGTVASALDRLTALNPPGQRHVADTQRGEPPAAGGP